MFYFFVIVFMRIFADVSVEARQSDVTKLN